MKRSLGHDIHFREGLSTFQLDLSDIDLKYNNIIVLDDLMDLTVDSPIISKKTHLRKEDIFNCQTSPAGLSVS